MAFTKYIFSDKISAIVLYLLFMSTVFAFLWEGFGFESSYVTAFISTFIVVCLRVYVRVQLKMEIGQ